MLRSKSASAALFLGVVCGTAVFGAAPRPSPAAPRPAAATPPATLAGLLSGLRDTAKALEPTAGMRLGYEEILRKNGLTAAGLTYGDFVAVRLLFEATRDAGLWNLQWRITNREPRSDEIWKQWRQITAPTTLEPTAIAE